MRHQGAIRTNLTFCKSYNRLRKRWQFLVDGTTVPSDGQPLDEDAAMSAEKKMVEHRESCEVCKKEDLAIKVGEPNEIPALELS